MADRKNLKYSSGWVPSGNIRGKTHAQTSQAALLPSSRGEDRIYRNDSSPSRTSSSSCDDFVQINLTDCDPSNDSRTTQSIDSDDSLELPDAGEGRNSMSDLLEQKQAFPASVLKSVRQAFTPSVDPALALGSHASNPAYSRSGETVVHASNKTSGTPPAHYYEMRSKHTSEMAKRSQPPRTGKGIENNGMRDATTPSNVDLGCELDGSRPETLCHLGEREDDVCDSWSMLPLQVELREVPSKGASQVGIRKSFEDLDSRTQRLAYDSDSLHLSMPTEGHLLVDENRSIARNGDSWTELPRQVELGHLSPSGKGREGRNHESFEDLETRTRKIRHLNHVPPLVSMTPTSENQKGNPELLDPMTTSGFCSIETVSSLSSNASDASLGSDNGQQVAKDFQECRDSQDKERVIQGMQPPTHKQKFFKHVNRKLHGQSNTLSNHESAGRKSGQHCSSSGEGSGNVSAQRRHSSTPSLGSGPVTPSQPPWNQHHHHTHCHQGHGHRHKHRHHVNDRNFGSENFEQKFERETEKMKTKVMSVWNNMKYGWTLKTTTNFRYDSAIWLLGQLYHKRPEDEEEEEIRNPNPPSGTPRLPSMEQFKRAFASIIWFTYRRQFTPLAGTKLTTDCGWGCMLRSCQMMVAQALVTHFLGPDWDMYRAQSREDTAYHRTIITWFCDRPSDKTPFSIHNLAAIGQALDKTPGDWYGPASAAHIFRTAMIKAQTPIPLLDQVCIYVAQDSTMYKQDVLDASLGLDADSEKRPSDGGNDSSQEWGRAVLLLIPVRLGGETINEMYVPCVQSMLAHKNCLGIIGGKPRHSLYFVGWQDQKLVYLDPHFCQDAVDCSQPDFPLESFHCMSPRKLPFLKMDPSCTIGFYCRTRADFDTLLSHVNDMVMPPKQRGQYPLFIVAEGRSADMNLTGTTEEGRLRIRRIVKDREGRVRSMTTDSEDFIVLGQSMD